MSVSGGRGEGRTALDRNVRVRMHQKGFSSAGASMARTMANPEKRARTIESGEPWDAVSWQARMGTFREPF